MGDKNMKKRKEAGGRQRRGHEDDEVQVFTRSPACLLRTRTPETVAGLLRMAPSNVKEANRV